MFELSGAYTKHPGVTGLMGRVILGIRVMEVQVNEVVACCVIFSLQDEIDG